MTKEISKQIMKTSKSKTHTSNDHLQKTSWPINKKKNKSNNNTKYAKKAYFRKVTAKKVVTHFGTQSNPFLLIKES